MEIKLHVSLDGKQRSAFEEVIKRFTGIAKIAVLSRIATGRSQAQVFIVDVVSETSDGPTGLHILKLDSRRGIRKEMQGYAKARETNLRQHMPMLASQTPTQKPAKTAAMLYSIAHGTLRNATSLLDLVDEIILYAGRQIEALAQILQESFEFYELESTHPFDLIKTELGSLLKGGKSIIRVAEDYLHLQADQPLIRFEGDAQVWPNPISFIQRKSLWSETRALSWPALCAHGDLHAQNVICRKPGLDLGFDLQSPVLIDFTHFREHTSLFYDLLYLELALLLRVLAPNSELRRQEWLQLGKIFDQRILVDAEQLGGPGVPSACILLSPLRRLAAEFIGNSDRPEDFESAFWLTGVAVALNYFRKLGENSFERKLALLIAARRLATLLDRLDVDFYHHQSSYELSWLSDRSATRAERSTGAWPTAVRMYSKWKPSSGGKIDLRLGLQRLGEAILEKTGSNTSSEYSVFSGLRGDLLLNLQQEAEFPQHDSARDMERSRILRPLDEMARRHLDQDFFSLCEQPDVIDLPSDLAAEDVDRLLADTRCAVSEIQSELRYKEQMRRNQERFGETAPELIARIAELRKRLDQKQEMVDHLQKHFQPKVFLKVNRALTIDTESIVVEQPIRVRVIITNIGSTSVSQVC